MAVFQQVRENVAKQAPGALLAFHDFDIPRSQTSALAKCLSLLHQQGVLRRLAKGLYYKPAMGVLGEIPPSYDQILAKLLSLYKRELSYLTGINIYRQMGLTTQVSKEFVIASDKPRSPVKIGMTEVRFVQSRVRRKVADVSLLQLLDAIWDIKQIPASDPEQSSRLLLERVRALNPLQRQALTEYALDYPPLTRALAGLFLLTVGEEALAATLKETLNPLTTFQIVLDPVLFPKQRFWYIS